MQLHLNHPPEPHSAPRLAAAIVEAAADISEVELDYSPGSIDVVEDIVDGFRTDGVTGEEMAESLVSFGCYVGEILARHAGGTWHVAAGASPAFPLSVRLPGEREYHPIDWVFQRLERGAGISIRGLYAQAVSGGSSTADRAHG
ncbi:hypothetical protein [Streptomyces sp. NPDC060184]|uniref:hypothetical protein n=1 Tax=Streptomyces sp. NPDC060184 TaxID=3347064 RepID=UPI003654F1DC